MPAHAVKPNVMILLDSSGSMDSIVSGHDYKVWALPDYVSTKTYAGCAPTNYTEATVYQLVEGSGYVFYAADIASVSSDTARAFLTSQGFWFGFIDSDQLRLYHGRYLNWQALCPPNALVLRQKIDIAKAAIKSVLGSQSDKRFGVMKFNGSNTGGAVVAEIGTSTPAIAAALNGVTAVGGTPLGPMLRDGGKYFSGTFGFASPIQGACQQNTAFIVSDGEENVGPPWVAAQAGIEYAADHSGAYAGTQNLVVNTVSFYLDPGDPAVAILKAAAAAGGGIYISANDPAQLQQAFFQIPPGVSMTSPVNNSYVLGIVPLAVGVSNTACVQSVQFNIDGVPTGAADVTAPFGIDWNSNSVPNGIHSITATLLDTDGVSHTSFPAFVTTVNDQTPPAISSVLWTTWYTSATVTWQTNEPADTQVAYGTSTPNTQTSLNPALVAAHSQSVSGLTPGTVYYSSVTSRDAVGNLTEQGVYQFTTREIVLASPPPNAMVLGNVLLSVGVNSAWESVQFKVDGNSRGAPITAPGPFDHIWNSNDVPNGAHTVTATVLDSDHNTNLSLPVPVTTSNDQTPPVIGGVLWTTWYTSATITWQTNEPGDSQVFYGTSTAYNMQTPFNPALVTAHSQSVSGLTPGTVYYSSVTSRDAAGNLAAQGVYQFTTQAMDSPGVLDHLRLTFGNAALPGPGVKTGNYPYALTAGDCYGLTIEAVDNQNRHNNLTASVAVGHYTLNELEQEVALVPGIALRDNYQLGVSSMVVQMVNGYVFLGSETDINKQLCFYRATQAPGSYKQPGASGDLHLQAMQVGVPAISGISASFIVWPGYADHLVLLAPDRTLAPATPTGVAGTLQTQNQGAPFLVRAYLADRYSNNTRTNTDTLSFASSLSNQTGFLPFEGAVVDGLLVSSVTVDACGAESPTLSVRDLTSPSIGNGQVTIDMGACGIVTATGFYQVTIPEAGVRAGDYFDVIITVKNVEVPSGAGSVRYAGNLVPLVSNGLGFTNADGVLKLPAFEFSIPEGYIGDYYYILQNQTYNRSGFIWVQLTGTAPDALMNATARDGAMYVSPGNPQRITAAASPGTIGPLSSTVITAKLLDGYGNGVPNISIAAQVTQGTGDLNVGGVISRSVTVQTDANGEVLIPFVSRRISETAKVRVSAPGYPGISAVEPVISITLLNEKTVAAYPNPAKITERPVIIEYRLDYDSDVEIVIYTSLGRKVWRKTLAAGAPGGLAGYNTVEWAGRNGAGQQVAVGVYGLHLRISANGHTSEVKTRLGIIK